ncbi:hypothetical protein MMC07_000880 [Pseudocyphellaria aurata]|nr:hypothetical protein [Pseudocyphellaria aurata]
MSNIKPTHLSPSPLGTKQYWDSTYTADLDSHAENSSHVGTTWFADSLASTKILAYLSGPLLHLSLQETSFLDLGAGNGEMLVRLREEGGFAGRMTGLDYSEASVELARSIVSAKSDMDDGIEFQVWDIMGKEPWMGGAFDVVLDKGTFDAVSLSAEVDGQGNRICEGYRARVEGMVKRGGVLLVTSCNWTEEELKEWFGGGELLYEGQVEYPRFQFGGGTGQSISSVCFRRIEG